MYLVQTPGEDFARRHAWVLGFTDISVADVVFGQDAQGQATVTFGVAGRGGYDRPVVFRADESWVNRVKMRVARFEKAMEVRSFSGCSTVNRYWIGRQLPSALSFEISARPALGELEYFHSMYETEAQIEVINDRARRGMRLRAGADGRFVEVPVEQKS